MDVEGRITDIDAVKEAIFRGVWMDICSIVFSHLCSVCFVFYCATLTKIILDVFSGVHTISMTPFCMPALPISILCFDKMMLLYIYI